MSDHTLPKRMRAVVCHGPEDYRLQETDVPRPGPGEVVIRVDACGICASDVKCYSGAALLGSSAHDTASGLAELTLLIVAISASVRSLSHPTFFRLASVNSG